MRLGFAGLGVMGLPMARNLLRSGTALTVWNRSPGRCEGLREEGAVVAASPDELFEHCDAVILMLANESAADAVLERHSLTFGARVRGRLLIQMATTSPEYSRDLARDVRDAGGRYVEAPVSGSRGPAEAATLIGLLAGEAEDVRDALSIVKRMCAETFVCGDVPGALQMKLSVNLYLVTMVVALAEAAQLAGRQGLDLRLFRDVLNAGPMASAVSRAKLEKLVTGDFTVQASISDVAMNCRLVAGAARRAAVATPLLDVTNELFSDAVARGLGHLDMAAVGKTADMKTTGASEWSDW